MLFSALLFDDIHSACNFCTRAAIWRIAESSVLFPNIGSWLGVVNRSHYLFGKAEAFPSREAVAGQANSIYLSLQNGKMTAEFEQIPNMEGATIPDFEEIQRMANRGMIIIGVTFSSSGSGHIVIVTPHADDFSSPNYNFRAIVEGLPAMLMPRVLECGFQGRVGALRETSHCLRSSLSESRIRNMKWYKKVRVYTSDRNRLHNNP